jgi:ribonuclease E
MSRTKVEIKRDCDYLLRLWDEIRELTLQSNAPAIIHEEGKLIRRAVRDLYSRDIEEIVVSGEEGYKAARDFMKVMMPSHSKRVIQYKDEQIPLFHRYQVESQIREMGEPNVTLKSGGYLVINPTEALVSIDVNSGRATRERHIEETAVKTNMEAAEEVARQLRLRDLGGLVVIDFIDMEDRRNNAKVERKLKESLSSDRARIQMGRISSFGLMEMSRQRLNPSLTEAQFEKCKLCQGQGHTRTVDNAAILAMRGLEEEGVRARNAVIQLSLPSEVAIYVLNHKRYMLADIERRYEFQVTVRIDDVLLPGAYKVDRMRVEVDADDEDGEGEARPQRAQPRSEENGERDNNRGRGRNDRNNNDRNRNRPRRNENGAEEGSESIAAQAEGEETGETENNVVARDRAPGEEGAEGERSRRRGRRGGRGRNRGDRNRDGTPRVEGEAAAEGDAQAAPGNFAEGHDASDEADDNIGNRADAAPGEGTPRPEGRRERGGRSRGGRNRSGGDRTDRPARTDAPAEQGAEQPRTERPARTERPRREDRAVAASGETPSAEPRKSAVEPKFYGRRSGAESSEAVANDAPRTAEEKPYAVVSEPDGQKKKGWWNRLVE